MLRHALSVFQLKNLSSRPTCNVYCHDYVSGVNKISLNVNLLSTLLSLSNVLIFVEGNRRPILKVESGTMLWDL